MSTADPLVSVVIPAYDPGSFLRDAIDSLRAQTLEEWEGIVVDDGSTEDLSWVDSVDRRVRRVRQENQGPSAARNTGIARASGTFLAFLDADDLWLPDKLATQASAFEDPAVALVSTAFSIIDRAGALLAPGYQGYAGSYEELLLGNGIAASSVAVRKTVVDEVGGFDVALRAGEDWDMWLRVAKGRRIVKLSDQLVLYRIHGDNLSDDYRAQHASGRTVLLRRLAVARREGDENHERLVRVGLRRLDSLHASQAFDAARATGVRRPLATAAHLLRSARLDPRIVVTEVRRHFPKT